MSKYDDFLIGKLSKGRSALGSELAKALIEKFLVKPDNARKIVQRASDNGTILSSKPLSFGKGQYLYLRPDLFFSRKLVKQVSEKHRKPLYRLLELLDHNKVISFYEGLKVTSSPEEKTSSKVSLLMDMIDDLEKVKLIVSKKDRKGNHYILVPDARFTEMQDFGYEALIEKHFQAMQLDTMFIPDILRWLRGLNLIGLGMTYRNVNTPAMGVKHNDMFWDAFAYSKTTGINLVRASEADKVLKQTLVTLDIVISRKYLQIDLDGYLARLQINLNSAKMTERKVMPIVIYQDVEEITLNRMKKLGFLAIDIRSVYGKNITKVMEKVRDMYSGSHDESLGDTIEQALALIENSGHTNQLRSLRGALFEALMHPVVRHFYPNSQILQGKKLIDTISLKMREFDLIIISSHPKEVLLVELKGYSGKSFIPVGSADEKDTLRYFFRGSVPIAQNVYKDDNILENHKVKATYITTGGFHFDAIEFIRKVSKGGIKPSQLEAFYDGSSLERLLNENGFDHEARIIKKYYLQQIDVT